MIQVRATSGTVRIRHNDEVLTVEHGQTVEIPEAWGDFTDEGKAFWAFAGLEISEIKQLSVRELPEPLSRKPLPPVIETTDL